MTWPLFAVLMGQASNLISGFKKPLMKKFPLYNKTFYKTDDIVRPSYRIKCFEQDPKIKFPRYYNELFSQSLITLRYIGLPALNMLKANQKQLETCVRCSACQLLQFKYVVTNF